MKKQLTIEEIQNATPDELVTAFMPLALKMARRQFPGNQDAEGDALRGLVKAANSYKKEKGPFVKWARLYIRQGLGRSLNTTRNAIYLPQAKRQKLHQVLVTRTRLMERNGNKNQNTLLAEIAEELGFDIEEVKHLLTIPRVSSEIDIMDSSPINKADEANKNMSKKTQFGIQEEGYAHILIELDLNTVLKTLPDDLRQECEDWIKRADQQNSTTRRGRGYKTIEENKLKDIVARIALFQEEQKEQA